MNSNQPHDHESCRELLSTLSDYVDGSLERDLCAKIEQHMTGCENCRVVINTLRKTIDLYHASAEPVQVPDEVRSRLYKRLNIEDFLK